MPGGSGRAAAPRVPLRRACRCAAARAGGPARLWSTSYTIRSGAGIIGPAPGGPAGAGTGRVPVAAPTFARLSWGKSPVMSDTREPVTRHPTDEPDGTTAYAASLRPPGESVTGDTEPESGEDTGPDPRTGYDPAATSGDTDVYRPD